MHRDVIVTMSNGQELIVRVEDATATEISDTVAMRLAYEHVYGDAHNDVVVARCCRIAPVPGIVIGLDGKRRWSSAKQRLAGTLDKLASSDQERRAYWLEQNMLNGSNPDGEI